MKIFMKFSVNKVLTYLMFFYKVNVVLNWEQNEAILRLHITSDSIKALINEKNKFNGMPLLT